MILKTNDGITFELDEVFWIVYQNYDTTKLDHARLMNIAEAMYGDRYGDYPETDAQTIQFLKSLSQEERNSGLKKYLRSSINTLAGRRVI